MLLNQIHILLRLPEKRFDGAEMKSISSKIKEIFNKKLSE